jgi:hypothetical protein
MSNVTYELVRASSSDRRVYLDGKHVGNIKLLLSGKYCYVPKGCDMNSAGELFDTIAEVKRSLEAQ